MRQATSKLAYNINEAAEAIGVSRATVYRMIRAGELKKFTFGGRTLIRADVVQAAIDRASCRNPAGPRAP